MMTSKTQTGLIFIHGYLCRCSDGHHGTLCRTGCRQDGLSDRGIGWSRRRHRAGFVRAQCWKLGMRLDARVEALRELLAANYQLAFFVSLRADVQFAHLESFAQIEGIIPS
jgi:hypothetical protein